MCATSCAIFFALLRVVEQKHGQLCIRPMHDISIPRQNSQLKM
jgi:hypothetical protein